MKHLIKSIKLSKREAVIGESIQVEIKIADPAVEVTVNNVGGATHFLQFKIGGSHVIVITASLGKQMEQKAETVKIRDRVAGEPALPLIWSTMDRYQPRTVVLTVANAEQDLTNVREYEWDFGDGTQGVSERGSISHDYSDALDPDKLFTQFHVQVKARQADGSVASATCTIAVFHVYAYNKIRKGILTPRVTVLDPVTIPLIFSVNEVLCSFTIQNLEDEELSFTAEKYEWLTTDEEEPQSAVAVAPRVLEAEALSQTMEAEVAPRLLESGATSSSHFKRTFVHTPPTMDLRVPARGTITVTRVFLEQQFKRSVFGVAIHLSGIGTCSKLPVMASAYIEVKLPFYGAGMSKGRGLPARYQLLRVRTSKPTIQ